MEVLIAISVSQVLIIFYMLIPLGVEWESEFLRNGRKFRFTSILGRVSKDYFIIVMFTSITGTTILSTEFGLIAASIYLIMNLFIAFLCSKMCGVILTVFK